MIKTFTKHEAPPTSSFPGFSEPPWEAPWGHLHKSRDPRVSCLNPRKTSRDLLQHVSRPDSPTAVSRHIAYWVHIAYCILSAALSTASSFRIWNSSTGILSLLGASEELRPWQRSWGRRLGIRKGGIELQESPWKFSSIYPQNQSLPTFCLCFHLNLWLYGGLSPTTSLWKTS